MSEDFGEKLQSVLNNPEMMQKIAAIASSFSSGGASSEQSAEQPKTPPQEAAPAPEAQPAGLFGKQNAPPPIDPRISLLHSIKPFLREEKRSKVDLLTKAVAMAGLLGIFKDKNT